MWYKEELLHPVESICLTFLLVPKRMSLSFFKQLFNFNFLPKQWEPNFLAKRIEPATFLQGMQHSQFFCRHSLWEMEKLGRYFEYEVPTLHPFYKRCEDSNSITDSSISSLPLLSCFTLSALLLEFMRMTLSAECRIVYLSTSDVHD